MNIPSMPWYARANNLLEGHEWLINASLVALVVLTLILLARGDRVTRAAWLVYLVSP